MRQAIKQKAYPVREAGGFVWIWMGAPDRMREFERLGMQCLAPESAQRGDQFLRRAARQAQRTAVQRVAMGHQGAAGDGLDDRQVVLLGERNRLGTRTHIGAANGAEYSVRIAGAADRDAPVLRQVMLRAVADRVAFLRFPYLHDADVEAHHRMHRIVAREQGATAV